MDLWRWILAVEFGESNISPAVQLARKNYAKPSNVLTGTFWAALSGVGTLIFIGSTKLEKARG